MVLFLLTLVTPLIYSRLLADGTDLPRYALISILALLSLMFFVIHSSQRPVIYLNKIFFILPVIFAWSAISLSWSLDYGNGIIEITNLFSSLIILFLAMQVTHQQQQYFILKAAIVTCTIVSIIGLLQAIGFNPFNIFYRGNAASTFINPNHASLYIDFFIPLLLILILNKNHGIIKGLYSVPLVLCITFSYILSSFGSLVALLVTVIFISFLLHKYASLATLIKENKNRLYLVIIIFSVLSLITLYKITPGIHSEPTNKNITLYTQKDSHKIRLVLYIQGIKAIIDNPVTGFGLGGFRAGILPYLSSKQFFTHHNEHYYYLDLHNDFLQQFTDTGIISGALFLAFFLYVLFTGLGTIKKKPNNMFIFAMSSGLLGVLLHAFVDFPFHMAASSLFIYLVSGLILSTNTKKLFFISNLRLKIITYTSTVLIGTFIIFTVNFNVKHIYSSKLVRDTAIALHKNKNCEEAVNLIDKSNDLFKYDFQNQASQAQVYGICPVSFNKKSLAIKNLVALNPTNFRARYLLGDLALTKNNTDSAFYNFSYITFMLPQSALGYTGLGNWALKVGKLEDAQVYFEKVHQIDPRNKEAIMMLQKLKSIKH